VAWRFWRGRGRASDELQLHREALIAELMAEGLDRPAAERRAFLEFGNVLALEEASRDVRGRHLADLTSDVRYALRTLRRHPGFAAVAILSLALAVGANAAVFSLINAVLLRPLPVHDPGRLAQITRLTPDGRPAHVSYPLFEHLRDHIPSITGAFAHGTSSEFIVVAGEPELVEADLVSGAYFDLLGLQPQRGRLLTPGDDTVSAAPAAVISDEYWARRFGRAPSVIGSAFTLRDQVFAIVGVMPASFRSVRVGRAPDLVVPLAHMLRDEQRREATNNVFGLVARLKPGASIAQATAEADALWQPFIARAAADVPGGLRDEVLSRRVGAVPAAGGINAFRHELSEPLLMLMAIAAAILLLASVNLSGLLVARAAARTREVSIRLAIGAGRGRLLRQFLTESAVLAACAGVAGMAFAAWFSSALAALFINGRELHLPVGPDWRVLIFTAAITFGAAGLAGLVPAVQALRATLRPPSTHVGVGRRGRLGRVLVSAQVAISMALLVGAGLFVGSLVNLYGADRGFDGRDVLVVSLRTTGPIADDRARAVSAGLLERLKTLPGVRAASAAQLVPVSGNFWNRGIEFPDGPHGASEASTAFNAVAPGYFASLRTPIVQGRDFDARDTATSPPVAIVNQRFARHFFGGEPAIGRRVRSLEVFYEIVGVAGDAAYEDLRGGVERTMYIPWTQRGDDQPATYRYLVQAADGEPMRMMAAAERAVREADPALRVREMVPYSTIIDRSVPAERILATLGGVFGVLALIVAGSGIFGLLAWQVARRTNELGLRMVLGATRRSMVGLVTRDVVWMLVPGLVSGALAAGMLTDFARGMLFGLTPTDARVYGAAALLLALAALVAAWIPARRAAAVDPLTALRHE
jgi:predicted permease